MEQSIDYRQAALLLSSLDQRGIDELLEHLPERDAEGIRHALFNLDQIPIEEEQRLLCDFLSRNLRDSSQRLGAMAPCDRSTHEFDVSSSNGDPLADIGGYREVDNANHVLEPSISEPLASLSDHDLVCLLRHERTSMIAAVLSQLPGRRIAHIVHRLGSVQRSLVLHAFALGVHPAPDLIQAMIDYLLQQHAEDSLLTTNPTESLQDIFVELSPSERQEMLDQLTVIEPDIAAQLAQLVMKKVS